ncbi:hypothetical protein CMV_003648 [Castanea mollissima]|uniref:Uncharacterized protein n=1 Tax=Castanea mollissima TaxID=60419 RepID=A0A8J4RZF2_9ROSI|nr:hypothetical protein CMV_003648 [Castanea mollissima]
MGFRVAIGWLIEIRCAPHGSEFGSVNLGFAHHGFAAMGLGFACRGSAFAHLEVWVTVWFIVVVEVSQVWVTVDHGVVKDLTFDLMQFKKDWICLDTTNLRRKRKKNTKNFGFYVDYFIMGHGSYNYHGHCSCTGGC